MPFIPKQPFPKTRGHTLRSEDWNDLVTEVQRLDTTKVNKAGDIMTAPLTINAALAPAGRHLSILGAGSSYLNLRAVSGGQEILVGADGAGGIVSTMSNHDLQLRAGGNVTFMTIKANGFVGIGTGDPSHPLHVRGAENIALFESTGVQAFIRISANDGLNNRVEITNRGGGRLSLWTAGAGDVFNILRNGLVGIGTATPGDRLHVQTSMTVGPFRAREEAPGRLTLSGGSAELALVRRNLNSWPATPQAGDRFVWYNQDGGAARLWTEVIGDIMTITRDGDVQIRGRIGNFGHPFSPRTPGWGGGIHTFDLEAEGTVWSRAGYQSGPRDVAETYPSLMNLEPGDVVCLDTHVNRIVLSEAACQPSVVGVVSSQPGLLLGAREEAEESRMVPVALCGMVPCKVVDENGPIRRGDLLSTSSTPGHAMKAKPVVADGQEFHRPGTIIGKALNSLDGECGVIDVLVTLM